MAYPLEIKEKAINLRKNGHSIKEIAKVLGIARGTSSLWLRNIKLNNKAIQRLEKRKKIAYYKMHQALIHKRQEAQNRINLQALQTLSLVKPSQQELKLLCAVLFWAEGAKNYSTLGFTNSDPKMIATFLHLFRKSFLTYESKFRVLMHLHEYHNETLLKQFWSNITNIPTTQFIKTYQKPHTKKRKRPNYKGCITVRYHDAKIARELHALYNAFAKKIGASFSG